MDFPSRLQMSLPRLDYPCEVKSPTWCTILWSGDHSLSHTQKQTIARNCYSLEMYGRYVLEKWSGMYDKEDKQRLLDLYKEYEDLGETLSSYPDTPDWKSIEEALNRILNEQWRVRNNAFTDVNAVPDEEEPKRKLRIRVKTLQEVEHLIENVTTHTLTMDLKYKIASKEGGMKIDDIILLYKENELFDYDTLDTHDITNGAIIYMLPRVRGKGLMESAKNLYNEARNILKYLGEFVPRLFADTKRAVTERDLSKVALAIGRGWEFLGLDLGLNRVQLDHISEDNPNNTAKKIYAMLATWLNENQSEATVGKLYQAMNDCGKVVRLNWKKIKEVFSDIVDVVLI